MEMHSNGIYMINGQMDERMNKVIPVLSTFMIKK